MRLLAALVVAALAAVGLGIVPARPLPPSPCLREPVCAFYAALDAAGQPHDCQPGTESEPLMDAARAWASHPHGKPPKVPCAK